MNEQGLPSLYEELGRVDPAAHARIKPRDHQRILRALEVYYTTGAPITQWQESSRRTEPRYPHTLLVLVRDRGELYDRIDARVDAMFAAGLLDEVRAMGVNKGDRVTIYMGRIPEIVIAMLACAKIGAVHSVVYGGFSVEALHGRIEDSQSKVAITADGAWLRGNIVPLKEIMDEALQRAPTVQTVIVVKRTGQEVHMEPGRDLWYHDLMNLPIAETCIATEAVDAEDPLFLLYTSGTTGKPKAILHTPGGYMVGVATTLKWVFDLKEEDTWWCAADPGWITGHSYIVYGPLALGATGRHGP